MACQNSQRREAYNKRELLACHHARSLASKRIRTHRLRLTISPVRRGSGLTATLIVHVEQLLNYKVSKVESGCDNLDHPSLSHQVMGYA